MAQKSKVASIHFGMSRDIACRVACACIVLAIHPTPYMHLHAPRMLLSIYHWRLGCSVSALQGNYEGGNAAELMEGV